MEITLAYKISRDLSNLHCDLHHLGISTKSSKEQTIVKVCCDYFRDEVQEALNKRFGKDFVSANIRFSLPVGEASTPSLPNGPDE